MKTDRGYAMAKRRIDAAVRDQTGSVRACAVIFCLTGTALAAAFMAGQSLAGGAEVPPPRVDDGAGRPRDPFPDAGLDPEPPRLEPLPVDAAVPHPRLDAAAPLPLER
jgi:hypothetical protein